MKTKLFFILSCVICFSAYSQTTFQPGYLIKDNGIQIKCLIKNEDWRNNPVQFQYKLHQNGKIQTGDLSNVKIFGIGQIFKFVRANVEIDRSEESVNNLDSERGPDMKKRATLFKGVDRRKSKSLFLQG